MKIIKMWYLIEPRDKIYVKGYGFLSFAKNMGIYATKVAKNVSIEYGQKLIDSAKKSTTDAIKTASKIEIQKTAEATCDLVGNKIADKITSVSTKEAAKNDDANIEVKTEVNVPKGDTYLLKKDNKLLMN